MARMISEQEKRERREAARMAKSRQALEARGFSHDEANRIVGNNELIRIHNNLVRAARNRLVRQLLGQASPELIRLVDNAVNASANLTRGRK